MRLQVDAGHGGAEKAQGMTTTRSGQQETRAHPYSWVRALGDGTAYVSGVLPYEPDGGLSHEAGRAVERVLAVLGERLEGAGFDLGDVVRTTVYLTDLGWRDEVNDAWYATFGPPRPARTTIAVAGLPLGSGIEVDAVVYRARRA